MSRSIADERELLSMVATGNHQAFKMLITSFYQIVLDFSCKIVGSRADAEEVTQDVFLKIWEKREGLNDIKNFKSYLFIVCRNMSYNKLRSLITSRIHYEQWRTEQLDIDQCGLLVENSQTDQMIQQLDLAIDALPFRQREVYLLHRHERLCYQEIADKLHIGKETVKSHLKAAIRAIKSKLGNAINTLIIFF